MPQDSSRRSSSDTTDSKASSLIIGDSEWISGVRGHVLRSPELYLHSGDHLERFLQYISKPDDLAEPANAFNPYLTPSAKNEQAPYAVLYDFQRPDPAIELYDPSQLDAVAEANESTEEQSQLLFLRGHPSSSWIRAVAKTFDVDVTFFNHHLELYSRRQVDSAHTWPPLLSPGTTESRFCLRTLGCLDRPGSHVRKDSHVRALRKRVGNSFESHLTKVRQLREVRLGSSLLRGVSVHDGSNFSLEQGLSLWTRQTAKGWFALVWLDVGVHDLVAGPEGGTWRAPLDGNPNNTSFTPTVLGREPDIAEQPSCEQNHLQSIPQNAKHLYRSHANALDRSLARKDMMYALSSVLRFAAVSENQFLNMLNGIVRCDIRQGTVSDCDKNDAALSNLLFNRDVLREHIDRLHQNILVIQHWASKSDRPEVADAVKDRSKMLRDHFRELLRKAESLAGECDVGAQRLMKLVSHAEAKKQIAQAERVERLTQLAFIFIPASFTASFCGMNFVEFGQGTKSIWIYFALTVPVVLLSLLLMISKFELRENAMRRLKVHQGRQHPCDEEVEMNNSSMY